MSFKSVDLNKLKGIFREKNKTYVDGAKALGISVTALSNKMNGKSLFDIEEINILVVFLDIGVEQAVEIFFAPRLA